MERIFFSRWFAKRLLCLVVVTALFACLVGMIVSNAAGTSGGWSIPTAVTVRKVSSTTSAQAEPNFLNNLDCTPLTYRLVSTPTMRTGCFTDTAFGLMDPDSEVVIFNGTDEGVPLIPYVSGQILVPWTKSGNLISLTTQSTDGDHIGLYKSSLAILQDQRDSLGRLTAKQLTKAPDMILKDSSGVALSVNDQTLAFSENGAWLVVETVSNAFVRINLATMSITPFAPAYGSQGGPSLLKSRVSITDDGRYVAISNEVAKALKVYDLNACGDGGQHPPQCPYYDYRAFIGQHVTGLQRIGHLRFANNDLLSFDAFATDSDTGTYEIAPAARITSLIDYLGLGDSYTSGEGAFDYLDGTDTLENMCHLSRVSYPLLLTDDLFGAAGGHSVACSGAVIRDIGDTGGGYRGQAKGVPSLDELQQSHALLLETVEANFLPGYVAQQRFVKRWQPAIATVSVGGDDIGFGNILQKCVAPHLSRHLSGNTCYGTYEDRLEIITRIDRTVPRWTALFTQLRREAPMTQFYAIGYPQVADPAGACAVNVQLNRTELEFSAEIIDYLDQSIHKAADAAGVAYINVGQALAGHRLCEAAGYGVALNGVTAGTDAGFLGLRLFGKESFHPNALGQSLIEQAILQQTHNFADGRIIPGKTPDTAALLAQAPITGRSMYALVPAKDLVDPVMKRGSAVTIHAQGAIDGLRAAIKYTVRLDGPNGTALGAVMSNAAGDVQDVPVMLPANTPAGIHMVDLVGPGQGGDMVDVTQSVYVRAGDTDSDADGIDDMLDSCPGAVNSGQDVDGDGIDDICDRVIAPVIKGGASGGGNGSGRSKDMATNSTTSTHSAVRTPKPKLLAAISNRTIHDRSYQPLSKAPRDKPATTTETGLQGVKLVLAGIVFIACCLLVAKTYTKNRRFPLQ